MPAPIQPNTTNELQGCKQNDNVSRGVVQGKFLGGLMSTEDQSHFILYPLDK